MTRELLRVFRWGAVIDTGSSLNELGVQAADGIDIAPTPATRPFATLGHFTRHTQRHRNLLRQILLVFLI